MNTKFHAHQAQLNRKMMEKGSWKTLQHLEAPMAARTPMEHHGNVLILSSNNYLGFSNHPDVIAASKEALDRFGAGTSSVRFICGTFTIHRELEEELARFSHTESALSYASCWTANTGTIPLLATENDIIISDELNHASIIDGIRLSKAVKKIYKHSDMTSLETILKETAGERVRKSGTTPSILVITDGVFSMEGDLALLPDIVQLAEKYNAVVMVDDSHGTGVTGPHGRGTIEHYGLEGEIDVITSTLGKALGGASGGYVASSQSVINSLIQFSRPQIFSNALPAATAAGALMAIHLLEDDQRILRRLRENTRTLRKGLKGMGFTPLEGESAIIPIIVGKTTLAIDISTRMLERGVFVTGFGFPVVPEGAARVRIQASATLSSEDIEMAMEAFRDVGKEVGLLT